MRLKKRHDLGLDEAKKRIDGVADKLHERFSVTADWDGDDLRVSGNGINGHIAVDEHTVLVELRLGLALMFLEGQIRSGIENAMDEHLN